MPTTFEAGYIAGVKELESRLREIFNQQSIFSGAVLTRKEILYTVKKLSQETLADLETMNTLLNVKEM
jgi:hypothetical protein